MGNQSKKCTHDFSLTIDCDKVVCRKCEKSKAEYDAEQLNKKSKAKK